MWISLITAAITLTTEMIVLGYKVARLWREAKQKKWIKEGREISQMIDEAKTDEDRRKLAEALFNHRAD